MRLVHMGVLCGLLTIGAAGCAEEDLQRVDRALADVNAVGQTVSGLPDSPAGALIPPGVRTIMEILGLGTAAACAFWQKIRKDGILAEKQTLQLTTRAIVAGIEDVDQAARAAIKEAVAAQMARRNIRDSGRKQVRELKNG